MADARATPRREPQPIVVETVGEPVRLSSLARLLLPYLQRPALRLVAEDREERTVTITGENR